MGLRASGGRCSRSVAVGVVAAGIRGVRCCRAAFLPPFNEGTLLVSARSTIPASRWPRVAPARLHRREASIAQVPEVRSVGRRTGRAELDEHAEGVHISEIDVDLERSARPKEEVYADIRARLAVLPVSINIGQPIAHRLDHMLSGVRAQIALKIYGEDLDTLRRLAEALRERLAGVAGLVDLQVEKQVLIPQVRIHLDYERAALYGMTPAAVDAGARGDVERPRGCRRSSRATAASTWSCGSPTRTARPPASAIS